MDAMVRDGGVDAPRTADAGRDEDACVADAGADDPTLFRHAGLCFEQTAACCSDADCDPRLYVDCLLPDDATAPPVPDSAFGRCRAWRTCSCATDSDCPPGNVCIANQRVCGLCVPDAEPCGRDAECPEGRICEDGLCAQACDAPCRTDDDCRGERRCLEDVIDGERRCVDPAFEDPLHCERDADCRSCVPEPPTCCDQLPEALVPRNPFHRCPGCCTCEGPCPDDPPYAERARCVEGRCQLVRRDG